MVCFSCGKAGHTATCCPNLNEAFPFLQPGWQTEKTPGGFAMIPPWGTTDHRRNGKRRLIGEGGSASRVSIHARPRYPGGGTLSTVSPRWTIFDDVSLAVEQSGEEPPLVSSGCSTVRTEKASAEDTDRRECPHDVVGLHTHRRTRIDDVSLAVEQSGEEPPSVSSGCSTVRTEKASAEDTHRQECPHDVVGLHVHKGTMWMSSDGVSLKNVESPYGGGVSLLLGAAGGPPPALFPVAPALLAEGPQLGPWRVQSCGSMRPLQGILPDKIIIVLHRTGIGRWIYMSYLTALHILLWKGALLAQKLTNHLRCWFLIMLTLLASMLLSRTLRVCWSIYLRSQSRP